ncbi:MAG: LCP family protein [Clostridiales bacterium]|nr:LCP family protein [Clostridiales bacterium]
MKDVFFSGSSNRNSGTDPNAYFNFPQPDQNGGEDRYIYSDSRNTRHSGGSPEDERPPKRKKHRLGCLTSLFLVAVILFLCGAGSFLYLFSGINYNEKGHLPNQYISSGELNSSVMVKNILLIGVDRRSPDEASRSDTMMLLSVDRAHSKIKLTSILRDSWVDIPGRGHAKLNAACSAGGAQLVIDTIEYNFKVKIDRYILVDFDMFTGIVDGLGGIDIQTTVPEATYMTKHVGKVFGKEFLTDAENGRMSHFNGEQALWYCRIRKLDSDFKRTERQRKVLSTVISDVKHTNPLKLMSIVKTVLPNIETDIGRIEMAKLLLGGLMYIRYDVEQMSIPANGTWSDAKRKGQDVLLIETEKNADMLKSFLYD